MNAENKNRENFAASVRRVAYAQRDVLPLSMARIEAVDAEIRNRAREFNGDLLMALAAILARVRSVMEAGQKVANPEAREWYRNRGEHRRNMYCIVAHAMGVTGIL